MHFNRVGRTYQLRIESADDLEAVLELDDALWVATSAPVNVFDVDAEFLRLIDTDANGRIYTDEIRAAIRWLLDRLADRDTLNTDSDSVPLSAIRGDTEDGRKLTRAAEYILDTLGAQDRSTIAFDQIRGIKDRLRNQPLNGDGVVGPAATDDADLAAFLKDAAACTGGVTDASGRTGVNEGVLARFMADVAAHIDWRRRSDLPEGESHTDLMPLGTDTPDAYRTFRKHADKVDLFFTQCRTLRFAPAAAHTVGRPEAPLADVDTADRAALLAALARAPLAAPAPDGVLPLTDEAVNPAYRPWVAALRAGTLAPILGEDVDALTEEQWQRVKDALAPYAAHVADMPGADVARLPLDTLTAYRDSDCADRVRALIAEDREVAASLEGLGALERLILYRRHLLQLVNNFVSFPQLYDPMQRALFETGSAVLDGRWFQLAVRVDDLAAHEAIARTSNLFIIYLEVEQTPHQPLYTVAIPATNGTKGNLAVGKRGVFFDTDGREFDARVVKLVENPISIGEALLMPFKRVTDFFAKKIEALSGHAEKGLDETLKKTSDSVGKAAAPPPKQTAAAAAMSGPAGLLVGGSVAIAALGSSFAYVTKSLAALEPAQIALGLLGLLAAILVPVGLTAWMKLRRQDLSALLEGCGWAINARMRLNRVQRRRFTRVGRYPREATGKPWPKWVEAVVVAVLIITIIALTLFNWRIWRQYRRAGGRRPAQTEEAAPAE